MDKAQNLDPKLKETYERVMGTNVSAPTPPSPAPQADPQQAQAAQPAVTVPQGSNDTKIVAGGGSKGPTKLSLPLVIAALVLFFAVYTFVWLFVFRVNIPFIPALF